MEEEVEALAAVYGEDLELLDSCTNESTISRIISLAIPSSHRANPNFPSLNNSASDINKVLHFMARPRGETISTSFVEASFYILLPSSYPNQSPILYLNRVSGLSDDGRGLLNNSQRFLQKYAGNGEPILFSLIDNILDQLDQSNNGECMICLQSLLTTNHKQKELSLHPVSLRTPCYHCFHIHCLCQWACQYYDQMNDQQSKIAFEHQMLSLRSFQGEIKTSESQLKKSQDDYDLTQRHIVEIQEKINRFGTPITPTTSALEELRQQFTQLNTQISKVSGKKKQKLLETMNKLKIQIQAEERKEQDPSALPSSNPHDDWADNDMTLPELEEELRKYKSQLPELEQKLKRCQLRLANALEDLNSEIRKQELKSQENAANWSQIPFPCPCCRTPLQDCLPNDSTYFQQCLQEASRQYQLSSCQTTPSESGNLQSLPSELQKYVREVQQQQAQMKLHQSSWLEVERTGKAKVTEDEKSPTPSGANRRNDRVADSSESKGRKNQNKTNRLQDKRYEPKKQESAALLVSDMITMEFPVAAPAPGVIVVEDADADMQEAIRLSLMDLQSEQKAQTSMVSSQSMKNPRSVSRVEHPRDAKSKKKASQLSSSGGRTSSAVSAAETSPPVEKVTKLPVEEEKRCLICDDLFDTEEHLYAFGSCDHACICGICAFRSRCILQHNICVMCRTPLDIMICREIPPDPHDSSTLFRHQYEMITQSSTKQVKKSSKQSADKRTGSSSETDLISLSSTSQETNLETSLPAMGKHVFHEESKMYVPRLYLKEILLRLMCFRCRSCGEIFDSAASLRQLKSHLQSHDLYLCEVCFTERKIFPSEMNVYTAEELHKHEQCGDPSLGTKGHPLCTLCERRFYDNDKLILHMMDDHHQCFICKDREREGHSSSGSSGSYFKNAHELQEHFKKAHFLCKQCKKLRVISVFDTELALSEHIERSHLVMGLRYR